MVAIRGSRPRGRLQIRILDLGLASRHQILGRTGALGGIAAVQQMARFDRNSRIKGRGLDSEKWG